MPVIWERIPFLRKEIPCTIEVIVTLSLPSTNNINPGCFCFNISLLPKQ